MLEDIKMPLIGKIILMVPTSTYRYPDIMIPIRNISALWIRTHGFGRIQMLNINQIIEI